SGRSVGSESGCGREGLPRRDDQRACKAISGWYLSPNIGSEEKTMQLELKVRNTDLADALQRYIEQRLSFELGRYGDRVGRVVVKVSGLSGSRGGTKKSCRISAELEPFGRVAVQETDLDLHAAVDRAAGRIRRWFAQSVERS